MKRHLLLFECLLYIAAAILVAVGAALYIVPQIRTLSYFERLGLGLSVPAALGYYLSKAENSWQARKLVAILATLHPRIQERGPETIIVEKDKEDRPT